MADDLPDLGPKGFLLSELVCCERELLLLFSALDVRQMTALQVFQVPRPLSPNWAFLDALLYASCYMGSMHHGERGAPAAARTGSGSGQRAQRLVGWV